VTPIVDTGSRPFELDVVRLVRRLGAAAPGAEGTVVAAHPDADTYTVELTDPAGAVVGLVEARRADLAVIWRP